MKDFHIIPYAFLSYNNISNNEWEKKIFLNQNSTFRINRYFNEIFESTLWNKSYKYKYYFPL